MPCLRLPTLGLVILLQAYASSLSAADADADIAKGLDIVTRVDQRNSGWGDSQSKMEMSLHNAHGDVSHRQLRSKTLEIDGDGDKGLTIFDQPRDVKGTAFLSFSHATEPDDQWIYLPALKRVKRINSRNKSGPFMGSEFAYEDMASFEIEKYSYRYLRDENYQGMDCYVVESYPVDKRNSGYTRLVSWFDKDQLQVRKIDYFDRKNELLKTLTFTDYQLYQERFWRAHSLRMVNHQTGKSTELKLSDFRFGTGLSSDDFNPSNLKRAK